MGGGIGKMFGVDKIFGGLLDAVGLGALKPLVSTAFDFATGNIPGVMQDLTSLMSSFGDGGFANNVAKNQPLPQQFDSGDTNTEYNSPTTDQTGQADPSSNATLACKKDNNDVPSSRISQLFKLLEGIMNSKDPSDTLGKLSKLFKLLSESADNKQTVQTARSNAQFYSGGATINA